mmetsp:Transcript_87314/g.187226  ORF Transcript_87314/g.187226 Transcript_87314/m.187226 type:complete len:358 (+) Transcript_87314:377-1450(+)
MANPEGLPVPTHVSQASAKQAGPRSQMSSQSPVSRQGLPLAATVPRKPDSGLPTAFGDVVASGDAGGFSPASAEVERWTTLPVRRPPSLAPLPEHHSLPTAQSSRASSPPVTTSATSVLEAAIATTGTASCRTAIATSDILVVVTSRVVLVATVATPEVVEVASTIVLLAAFVELLVLVATTVFGLAVAVAVVVAIAGDVAAAVIALAVVVEVVAFLVVVALVAAEIFPVLGWVVVVVLVAVGMVTIKVVVVVAVVVTVVVAVVVAVVAALVVVGVVVMVGASLNAAVVAVMGIAVDMTETTATDGDDVVVYVPVALIASKDVFVAQVNGVTSAEAILQPPMPSPLALGSNCGSAQV